MAPFREGTVHKLVLPCICVVVLTAQKRNVLDIFASPDYQSCDRMSPDTIMRTEILMYSTYLLKWRTYTMAIAATIT